MDKTIPASLIIDLDGLNVEVVDRMAAEAGVTPEQLAKEALKLHLQRYTDRLAFNAACERSLQHYRETGLHVTDDEIDAWLSALEAGNDNAEPPKCHR